MSDTTLFHTFFDHLPGMAFQLQMDNEDEYYFNYVSPGSAAVLDINRIQLEQHPHLFFDNIHSEDQPDFLESMRSSILNTSAWNWEGRFVLSNRSETKWVNLRATCRRDPNNKAILEGFLVNISQAKRNEIEIRQAHQQLRELSSYIENFKEAERGNIARKIHDDIGVPLTALRMDLAWLTQRLPRDDAVVQKKSKAMAELLENAGKTVNSLIHSLRPGFLDCFGVVAAIEIEAKEFTKRTGIFNRVIKSKEIWELSEERSTTLFRAFQDILNSIVERTGARQIKIAIVKRDDCVSLIVSDDGKGYAGTIFAKQQPLALRIIEQRIHHLGGCTGSGINDDQEMETIVCLPLIEHDSCSHFAKNQQALF